MTGIGPVEPYEPDDTLSPAPAATPDVMTAGAANPRTLRERWAVLPPWGRHAALAAVAAGTVTALALALRPTPTAPTLSPWPSQVTYLHYKGHDATPDSYRFLIRVQEGKPVTISQLTLPFAEFRTTTAPRLPLTVKAHDPASITVRIRIRECPHPPRRIDLPHLDLVIRNDRAQQQHSFLFGGTFPTDLARQLHAACARSAAPASPSGQPAALTHR
ncbi:hypothetical protein [Streptomyces sp. VRA16 Mangrove soil]|uniref:hypothetical protein n=1 Tax=Streptomyces sp. VRA16 Mangrove soil TaxID=2817434 RepID=UPI001A9EACB6|nr:hypothetical protein [Streptomyces sp. VRA16 Mangrove soil]MBO1335416.1 hypothetical protein [Streptomyces sp. VRA16 Mangrove soil]